MNDNIKKIREIIDDYKNRPNSDLEMVLNFLQNYFENTKANILSLTEELDLIEIDYNKIFEEYKIRTNGK